MEVQLYVYDLSKGLARQFSASFIGTQIDAVYHTSIVFDNIEYFFGQGIQTCHAGTTHHGRPIEIIRLGTTSLPMELILEYLDSLKQVYTAQSYDLFMKNCNNFSNDFAMFLVGKGIPEHITSLPQTVLDTPFGQMLRPQIDSAMRSVTQAPVPPIARSGTNSLNSGVHSSTATINGADDASKGKVHNVTSLREVERLLDSAKDKCAVIFFTSSTCAPCKLVYGDYDELAAEAGDKAVLIKVDINFAMDVSSKYNVRATPTFISFLRGQKDDEWSGANPSQLRGNVRLLIESAFPAHPHTKLRLDNLHRIDIRPVTFSKVPPLEKLTAKMGSTSKDPIITSITQFIQQRTLSTAAQTPVPDLQAFATFLDNATTLSPDILFPLVDLLRLSLLDPRVSGFFAEPQHIGTIERLLQHINAVTPCPYNLNLVTLQMACNLFSSPLFRNHVLASPGFAAVLTKLLTTSFLDDSHATLRTSAAALAFNVAVTNYRLRREESREGVPEDEQVELLASLLEVLESETENKEVARRLVVVIGLTVYLAPVGGEVLDLCKAMDAEGLVKKKEGLIGEDEIVKEVGRVLLTKGL